MTPAAPLRAVDAVTVPVPTLDEGLAFYRDALGHELRWRDDATGQAGLGLPDAPSEIVLSVSAPYAPVWLVASVPEAARTFEDAGGAVADGPHEIPVGRLVVVTDPFGNRLALVDLSKGLYTTDADGRVTGVTGAAAS